jgi:hypothetical protein
MRLQFDLTAEQAEDEYWIYVAHQRQAMNSSANLVQQIEAPPTIDGNSDDWPEDVSVLASNSARQFLRGAGLWQGEAVDSHQVRLAWDENNLYILAEVRDPEHKQDFTLSSAWQGDTLWIYMTGDPNASRLSAKFTLAQTPDGPQVWDWRRTGFMEGAELSWTPREGGYLYEASIPWSSLDIQPEAGMEIGFEAGRGVGGNAFMNLTGRDPDVPANLLKLILTAPGMAEAPAAPSVALDVRLNDYDAVILPQTVSPDSDYFWLDRVIDQPVRLNAGENTIRYRYAGDESENPGLSKVDAFYLQPVIARRLLRYPDGRLITLTYDTSTGQATWTEES